MTTETILIWLIVGLVAGILASRVVGTGLGLVGDMVIGMAGAVLGGFIFREAHWQIPLAGLPGAILVAFVGAVVLLVLLRLARRARI